jgi:ABC-type branched-subunit amino acid transport system substrate-binding protein
MIRARPTLLLLAAGILAGCGRAERTIHLILLTDLTGPRAVYGEGIHRAATLALADRRGALLAAGWDVNLLAYDAAGSTTKLETTARGITADPAAFCAVVQTTSDGNLAAAKIFHSAGITNILPAETTALPNPASQPETIFLSPDDRAHGASDAGWALTRKAARILLTTDSNAHALSIADGFRARAQAGNAAVYDYRIDSNRDLADWTSTYQSIHPELVYFSGSSTLALSLLDRMAASGFTGLLFFAQDDPEDPLPASFKSETVTLAFSSATVDSAGAAGRLPAIPNFRSTYGADPPAIAALGYDAASFCVSPLLKKETTGMSGASARVWVLDQLLGNDIMKGVTGSYPFAAGRPSRLPVFIGEMKAGFEWTPVQMP